MHCCNSDCEPLSVSAFGLMNNREMTTGRFTGWWYSPMTYTFLRQVSLLPHENELNQIISANIRLHLKHNMETMLLFK